MLSEKGRERESVGGRESEREMERGRRTQRAQ